MRQSDPSRAATWVLRHLVPGEPNDALAGDLLEEFRTGRSAAWYRHQVIAAVTTGWAKEILKRMDAVVFAALWAIVAPAWVFEYMIYLNHSSDLASFIWNLPWPWSTICDIALQTLLNLSFVWSGLLLFFGLEAGITGRLNLRQFSRGIARGAFAFLVLSAAILAMALLLPSRPSQPVDWRTIKPLSTIAEFTLSSCVERLPFFIATLFSTWGIARARTKTQILAGS